MPAFLFRSFLISRQPFTHKCGQGFLLLVPHIRHRPELKVDTNVWKFQGDLRTLHMLQRAVWGKKSPVGTKARHAQIQNINIMKGKDAVGHMFQSSMSTLLTEVLSIDPIGLESVCNCLPLHSWSLKGSSPSLSDSAIYKHLQSLQTIYENSQDSVARSELFRVDTFDFF